MLHFKTAKISTLQKLELYQPKLGKSQDCVTNINRINLCYIQNVCQYFGCEREVFPLK